MDEDNRFDGELDAVVNRGLAAAFLLGLSAGMKVMREGGVPAAVIERVFFEPQRRRSTDWKR
jgi:hypothetical protein